MEISLFYICVYDLCTVFQHRFNGHCDYVIMGVSGCTTWYGYWLPLIFILHSTGMVILPLEIILLQYMIWVPLECIFEFTFKYNRVCECKNIIYDWRILLHNVFQPYLSFNSMWNEKSFLMMPISYIAIILSLMVK